MATLSEIILVIHFRLGGTFAAMKFNISWAQRLAW
jgi:hypothetical protein